MHSVRGMAVINLLAIVTRCPRIPHCPSRRCGWAGSRSITTDSQKWL